MHYELYVDSLFLINFTMNLYLLMLVDHSTLSSAVPWRLLVGALFGAGSYLLLFVIGMALPWKLLLGAAAALLMLPITFSVRGLRSFLKLTEKMLFFSFSMGGVLLLLIRCFRFAEGVLTSASGLMAAGGFSAVLEKVSCADTAGKRGLSGDTCQRGREREDCGADRFGKRACGTDQWETGIHS